MVIQFQFLFLSTEHIVLLDTPDRLRSCNMTALEDNGFLVASRVIHVFCDLIEFCNKTFDGLVVTPQYLSNFKSAASLLNALYNF